jgi:dienelactone hydrolase
MIAADWNGAYTLRAADQPVAISVRLHGRKATVALGRGHASSTTVVVTVRGEHVRFAFPGLPSNIVFDGAVKNGVLSGSVRQGLLRGAFRLRRGRARVLELFGLYRADDGRTVSVVQATGFPAWLVELPEGETHGIGAALTVGNRLGDTSGNGSIVQDATGISWKGVHYARVALRQREVRVGVDAATLTIPPGPGPFPAAVMVHGSGPQTREEFQAFAAYLTSIGVAVLADDKRGIGQSGGTYPGEAATDSTLDILARDAQAEVRLVAALPQIDPKRVGLFGDSQAGWIIPLAAAREHAVRWAIPLAGPTATVDETDLWGSLAGKSQSPPSGTHAEMLAQVRTQRPSGFDPRPWLEKLSIPVFWVFADDDRNVPTELSIERLQPLKSGHDFSWTVLEGTHALLQLPTGLYSSLAQSRGFLTGLYPAVGDWLRSHNIAR